MMLSFRRCLGFLSFLVVTSALSVVGHAQDMLILAFEDSIVVQGDRLDCDLYYIFIGDANAMEQGELLQVVGVSNDPNALAISRARFRFTKPLSVVRIDWQAQQGQKFGSVETGKISKDGDKPSKYIYQVLEHTGDASQENIRNRVRAVRFESLPQHIKNACLPTMISLLPPEERLRFHQLRAQQMEAEFKAAEMYLDALK
jgi:hypothetical protein